MWYLTGVQKMNKILIIAISVALCEFSTEAAECEHGWTAYKDQTCIVASADVYTFEEAKRFCSSKSTGVATSTLVMVKEAEVQEFLAEFTKDKYDNLWLAGKYDDGFGQFKWEDGNPLTFTNWENGYPRVLNESDACIQLRPVNVKLANDLPGKWEDTSCLRRNLALCQRTLTWSLEDATREIISLRKKLETTEKNFKAEIEVVNSRVIPIGSIYVEYFNQPSPEALWPNLRWEDVSISYAGLFFRTIGGSSESWGTNQEECAPRLHQVQYSWSTASPGSGVVTIPATGWSPQVLLGAHPGTYTDYEILKFNMQGCEVRPKNQAIRIWKRLA